MSHVEKKLQELGFTIPLPPAPVAAYVPGVRVGDYVYTSGQIPLVNGEMAFQGKVGEARTLEDGYAAARICVLNCLGVIKSLIGDLDNIEQVVKVVGFVNSADGFNMQPKVINGASELLGQILGDQGKHARSAVGVNELPLDATCEVEMIVKVKAGV